MYNVSRSKMVGNFYVRAPFIGMRLPDKMHETKTHKDSHAY